MDYNDIKKTFDDNECPLTNSFKHAFLENKKKVSAKVHNIRNDYLKSIYLSWFPDSCETLRDSSIYINCEINVSDLFAKIAAQNIFLASEIITDTCECEKCVTTKSSIHPKFPLILNESNFQYDLTKLQRYTENFVDSTLEKCKCIYNRTKNCTLNHIITLEVEPPAGEPPRTYCLKDIQNNLNINGLVYKLFAVIERIENIKHYIALVRRRDTQWQKYDNLNYNYSTFKPDRKLDCICLIFYVRNDIS